MAATAGGNSDEIYLWRLADAAPLHRLAGKGKPNLSAGWSPDGKSIAWGNTFKYTSPNDRGPLERSFTLADLEIGPSPDASYRRARESRGSLFLQRTGPTSLEVKQQDAVVAKIAPPHPYERIRSFSFVTGDRVAVGADYVLYLFDARTGAKIREFQGHTGEVWAVAPSPDGRFLLSASSDQTVRIWAPDRDKPLLSLFVAGDDWIAWTPEGYYAAGPGGENLMGWQVSNGPEQVGTFVRASQFRKSLYRPDVIKLVLKTGSVATALERLNEPAKVVKEVLPPLVAITSPDSNGARLDKPELEVRAVAKAQPGHPVTAFRLLLDGRPYNGEPGRKEVPNDPAGGRQKARELARAAGARPPSAGRDRRECGQQRPIGRDRGPLRGEASRAAQALRPGRRSIKVPGPAPSQLRCGRRSIPGGRTSRQVRPAVRVYRDQGRS